MYTISLFSDNDLEEDILHRTDDYPTPSTTEAPSGLNADVQYWLQGKHCKGA